MPKKITCVFFKRPLHYRYIKYSEVMSVTVTSLIFSEMPTAVQLLKFLLKKIQFMSNGVITSWQMLGFII